MNAKILEAAFQLFNFLVLAWLLVRFGKQPIRAMLEAKSLEVSAAIRQGEESKRLSEMALAESLTREEAARVEVVEIAQRAEAMGKDLKKEIEGSLQREAERIRQNTREAILLETRLAVAELRQETIAQAFEQAEGKLSNLDEETHSRLLLDFARKAGK
ncbi:MAG TPA: ATP synthase F0 subunit B [Chroococcales cyanobacterium]|jgi:F-type H+-transporting ATPase subunit b